MVLDNGAWCLHDKTSSKNGCHQWLYVSRENLSHLLPLQEFLWVWPRLLSNYCLCTGSQSIWNIVCTFEVQRPHFLCFWLSYTEAPYWFSKPEFLVVCLSGIGILGRGAGCGYQMPHSLERTSAIVIILLTSHPLASVGLDYTAFPPLLLVLFLFLYL